MFCQYSFTLKAFLLLLITCSGCLAQADFRFYVFDETRNDRLHYEFVQDITIYNFASQKPRLVYRTEYRIYGINQEKFTFATESYDTDLSRDHYAAILKRARTLPLDGLDSKAKNQGAAPSSGWIKLDGRDHTVKAAPNTAVRQQWQAFLEDLLARHAPANNREVIHRTLEGETVPPLEIDFATLLKDPKKYNGRRIRITGFYHGEFEGSSFAETKKEIENYRRALWLGGESSFADPKRISGRNDITLTVDGTFELGPGGHMGLWMGELSRITASQPVMAKKQPKQR